MPQTNDTPAIDPANPSGLGVTRCTSCGQPESVVGKLGLKAEYPRNVQLLRERPRPVRGARRRAVGALKREAAQAANARDIDRLWGLCEAFLATKSADRTRTSPNTVKAYRRGVLDLLEQWPRANLLRSSRNAPDLYVMRLMLADLKPRTIAVKLGAAKLLYKTLRWAGTTTADPFGDVKAPKDHTPAWEKRKPYTFEEIQAMRAKARPVDHALILFGAHGGLRVAEMVDLLWSDVDLSAGTLVVRHGKGGKRRTVHLSPGLVHALEGLPRRNARVLGFSTSRARARMRSLTFRALVPYRGIHALRHCPARGISGTPVRR